MPYFLSLSLSFSEVKCHKEMSRSFFPQPHVCRRRMTKFRARSLVHVVRFMVPFWNRIDKYIRNASGDKSVMSESYTDNHDLPKDQPTRTGKGFHLSLIHI